MKTTCLLFIGFFLIAITSVAQDSNPKLEALQKSVASLEREVQVINKKIEEIKKEINLLSGTSSKIISTDDQHTELVKKYGESDAIMIKNKGYRIGMTKEMLIESLGAPKRQSAMKLGSSLHEKLEYQTNGKRVYFDFEDGILTSFNEY